MKAKRVFYAVVMVVSLGLAAFFCCRYYFSGIELGHYRELSRVSNEALVRASARLTQSKEELGRLSKKVAALNKAIAVLGESAASFKNDLQVLREEREQLKLKIAGLVEKKTVLEKKFHSLQELKKALKVARVEKYRRDKLEKIRKRLMHVEMFKTMDLLALRQGNRGYLVKKGETTFKSPRIRVKLEPVSKISCREVEETE